MDDREVAIIAAKKRMAAFRLRQGPSAAAPTDIVPLGKHHARSHSRNNSITAFPHSASASAVDNGPPFDDPLETPTSVPTSPSPRSRPNSHHRRRSSVSTRRESAEMMGVTPPPETSSDYDSDATELRRLALWTLEGKNRSDSAFIGSFTKVEIPELDTREREVNVDVLQAPKSKPSLSAFGMGNSLVGKRDSFGKLLISSSNSLKDQLHTLMEEEEEEEEETQTEKNKENGQESTPHLSGSSDFFQGEPKASVEPHFRGEVSPSPASVPSRHRPTNLNLRTLSLTPESLPLSRTDGLPTPSPTPSPRLGSGLRALTLAPSPSPAPATSSRSSMSYATASRQSTSICPSMQPTERVQRHASLGSIPVSNTPIPPRKSSISYKRALPGDHPTGHLPTPGPTPTSPKPPRLRSTQSTTFHSYPVSGPASELERPLSPTEQAFLFRSHTSLLCRISDLEKALADGRGRLPAGAGVPCTEFGMERLPPCSPSHERPTSITSMSSLTSASGSESSPSDEMLQLVADLKAERDELMRDVAEWRACAADLERQVGTLTRRVEAERREGWVVRERLGVVEVEKKRVSEEAELARFDCRGLEKTLQAEVEARIRAEEAVDVQCARREAAERGMEALRSEMAVLRARAEQADADLQSLLTTPKVDSCVQRAAVRHLNSMDSGTSGSTTDVEEFVPVGLRTLKLNAVVEEEERDLPHDVTSEGGSGSEMDGEDEEDDELAFYEDDDGLDDDMIFSDDQTSSSFGSIARSNSHLLRLDLAAVAPAIDRAPEPAHTHAKTGSMERGWSFPIQPGAAKHAAPKVDHFFECLDGLEESDAEPEGGLPTYDSATAKQFWRVAAQADNEDDNAMPPFILPAHHSPPRKEKEWKEVEAAKLEVVAEVEEEEVDSSKTRASAARARPDSIDVFNAEPVTPRPKENSLVTLSTPTKSHKVRRTSSDLTVPGFKPYSGSVPVLKAPPPPKRSATPAKTHPPPTKSAESMPKHASPTQIPQLSRSPSSSFTTPRKPRASPPGPTFIPRLSTSPKPTPTPTPTKIPSTNATTKALMLSPTPTPMPVAPKSKNVTTPTPFVFVPQPLLSGNSVTRSSILPHSAEPHALTRLTIPQQNTTLHTQGLTAKVTQQMQSFRDFLSPWSPNALTLPGSKPERLPKGRVVCKGGQLERLRVRLQREGALVAPYVQCASCKDEVIEI